MFNSKRRDSESSTGRHRSKISDCVMKSERDALVRGSDPPSGHTVHNTVDKRRAPARRRLMQEHLAAGVLKTDGNKSRSLSDGQIYLFFQVWERAEDAAGNLSLPRPRTHLESSRPSSCIHCLARHVSGLAVG